MISPERDRFDVGTALTESSGVQPRQKYCERKPESEFDRSIPDE
jgi:hypothetical protein